MVVYIKNMDKPKFCKCEEYNCFAWDDEKYKCKITEWKKPCPLIEIDLVRCGECKHKPIKHDPEGDEFGFNLVSPNGYDNLCPCLNTDDGFYSYMPDDNFFCAYGERRANATQHTQCVESVGERSER